MGFCIRVCACTWLKKMARQGAIFAISEKSIMFDNSVQESSIMKGQCLWLFCDSFPGKSLDVVHEGLNKSQTAQI
jgi:hypothetical protein